MNKNTVNGAVRMSIAMTCELATCVKTAEELRAEIRKQSRRYLDLS